MFNNENTWTQGGKNQKTGPVDGVWWRVRGGIAGVRGARGGIALGEIPNVVDRVIDAINHHGMYIYSYVTNLHVLHMYPRT